MAEIHLPMLERVQIASPCDARWEDMKGDDKVRHCGQCDLNVHNLSAMTRAEAEGLLAAYFDEDGSRKQGRFCGKLFRRADGTVLTADCPVGFAAVRAKVRWGIAKLVAMFVVAGSAVVAVATGRDGRSWDVTDANFGGVLGRPSRTSYTRVPASPLMHKRQPFRWVIRALAPKRAENTQYFSVDGDVRIMPRSQGIGKSGAQGGFVPASPANEPKAGE